MLTKTMRLTLVLFVLCAYSATVYTFGKNYSPTSTTGALENYSHSHEDVEKIRQAIQHGNSSTAQRYPLPGVDCVVYRDDVETESFNAQLAECMQPNILLLEE
jgi:hypothetical protein